ncbi:helix-turn-helix transcriptional regulator [Microbacterium halophytorum]|uniref:helix-turn-helix transcriptional regulator n=1 Tax=Microbacterium halophytorum TaxID=2067568 RepID=UPI000CFB91A7|nr:WYL domain-containing protein [Microbacterium halophytorum]
MTPLVSSDRVRIALTLVPFLLERGEVSVADAAAEFGVAENEMRRMVQKLTLVGLPGEAGYWQQPHELFDIDWDLLDGQDVIRITQAVGLRRAPRLSSREAAALVAGLRLAAAIPGVGDTDAVRSLSAKLAAGAAAAPADVVVVPPAVDAVRDAFGRALRDRVALRFRYRAPDAAETTRTVDPVKLTLSNGQWYLQGWCHERRAMRTFNLDRVSEPRLTGVTATHTADAAPDLFAPGDDDDVAVIRYRREHARLAGDYLAAARTEADGGYEEASLRLGDARSLKRLAALRGGLIEVLSPPAARRAAAEWARAGLAQYGESTARVGHGPGDRE